MGRGRVQGEGWVRERVEMGKDGGEKGWEGKE